MYRIFNLFSYIFSIVILLFILILILIQNVLGNQRIFDSAIKGFARIVPILFGIRVLVSKSYQLDKTKQYVFISNHVNLFDGFILYGYISHFVRGVELESHFKWPVWGSVIKRLGNIPISHKNPKAALKSLDVAGESIKNGTSIIILPEGHRTRDGQLQAFHRGAFRLAKHAEVDIIPLAMKGAWDRKTVSSPFVKSGVVELIVGEPISKAEIIKNSDKIIRDKAFQSISEMLQ